jgi:hypothetical protein
MESTTRIDDLPENITMRIPNEQPGQVPTYAPMNIHPNPYGNSLQPNVMPLPQPKVRFQEEMPQMRLPSRDIPMDQTIYQQDEEIQPNYIPHSEMSTDYVKDYEEITEENIHSYENQKENMSMVDRILSDLQTPILVALLFFIFQMPMINTMFYRNFSFLSVYNTDGNINFYGIALKSIVFGSIFYGFQTTVHYLS